MKESGIGICGIVFLIFLVLKLAEVGEVADWSWWWVTCPIWSPVAAVILILLVILLITVIEKRKGAKQVPNIYKPQKFSKWEQRLEQLRKNRETNNQKSDQ